MKNKKRSVNRNLIFALIAYNNLDLGRIGALCDPPVTRAAISMLLSGKGGGNRLMEQISGILSPSISGFLEEALAFYSHEPFHVLFPDSVSPVGVDSAVS
jgi:hypothetical protein